MKIILTHGYPFPCPEGQDFSGHALDAVLTLADVQSFDSFMGDGGKCAVIVTFATKQAYRFAKAMTGWPEWDGEGLALEALTGPSGYVCGWIHPGCPDWPAIKTEFRALHMSAN